MPRFRIHHVTKYSYDAPVRESANQIVLFPIKDEFQEVIMHDLKITDDPDLEIFSDYYGNQVGAFTNADPHQELIIESKLELITKERPLPPDTIPAALQWEELDKSIRQAPYIDFLYQEQFGSLSEMLTEISKMDLRNLTPLKAAEKLNAYVYNHFKYIKGITSVESTLDEVWKLKAGVCQDFAHILLLMLRLAGIPARYMSGYICPHRNGMRGEGATHAWVEAFIPSYGWVGLDPTNKCLVNDLHIRLAVGRNFADCSPVKGTYKGVANHKLEVGVGVSYESGKTLEEPMTILTTQKAPVNSGENSYRKFLEMQQQQQQQ